MDAAVTGEAGPRPRGMGRGPGCSAAPQLLGHLSTQAGRLCRINHGVVVQIQKQAARGRRPPDQGDSSGVGRMARSACSWAS